MIPHCWSQSLKRTLKKGCGLRTEEAKRKKRQLRKDTKSGREREREMCPFSLSPVNQLFRWPEPGWNCCLTEKVGASDNLSDAAGISLQGTAHCASCFNRTLHLSSRCSWMGEFLLQCDMLGWHRFCVSSFPCSNWSWFLKTISSLLGFSLNQL